MTKIHMGASSFTLETGNEVFDLNVENHDRFYITTKSNAKIPKSEEGFRNRASSALIADLQKKGMFAHA